MILFFIASIIQNDQHAYCPFKNYTSRSFDDRIQQMRERKDFNELKCELNKTNDTFVITSISELLITTYPNRVCEIMNILIDRLIFMDDLYEYDFDYATKIALNLSIKIELSYLIARHLRMLNNNAETVNICKKLKNNIDCIYYDLKNEINYFISKIL